MTYEGVQGQFLGYVSSDRLASYLSKYTFFHEYQCENKLVAVAKTYYGTTVMSR